MHIKYPIPQTNWMSWCNKTFICPIVFFIIFWIILFCRLHKGVTLRTTKKWNFRRVLFSFRVNKFAMSAQMIRKWKILFWEKIYWMKLTARQLCILMMLYWNLKIFSHLVEMFNAMPLGVCPGAGCKCKFRTF